MPDRMTAMPSYYFPARRQAYFNARSRDPKKITLFFINSHCSPSGVEVSLPKSRAAFR
jgi:hypothetical protein